MPVHRSEAFFCRMIPSEWNQGLATPTYFVSQKKKKSFFTRIQDALDTVPPHSRIEVVGGGLFNEKLTIDRPVELCVKRGGVAAVLNCRATTLTLSAETAFIQGFIIDADSAGPCVVVTNGRPTIRHCCISGLEVTGTACPAVDECRLGATKGPCVHLCQKGGGFFQNCVFTGVTGHTILVESTGAATFSYNTIGSASQGQVYIRGLAEAGAPPVTPHFTLNTMVDRLEEAQDNVNYMGGIDFSPLDRMVFPINQRNSGAVENAWSNTTHATTGLSGAEILAGNCREMEKELRELPTKQVGMRVSLVNAEKIFLANLQHEEFTDPVVGIGGRGFSASFLVEGPRAQPHLSQNTIQGCKLHGIVLRQDAGGWYEGNYISKNKGWAILLEPSGKPGGSLSSPHREPPPPPLPSSHAVAGEHASVSLSTSMATPATSAPSNGKAKKKETGEGGMGGRKDGEGTTSTTVPTTGDTSGQASTGHLNTGIIPSFVTNHITSNRGGMKICGVPVKVQQQNVFFSNRGPQIYVEGGHPELLIDRASFRSVAGTAVWCVGEGGGTLRGCEFENCGVAVRCEKLAHPRLSRCTMDACAMGAYVTHGAKGTFSHCVFNDNRQVAARVEAYSRPTFSHCHFLSCTQALHISHASHAHVLHCTMQDCPRKTIEITEQAQAYVAYCAIQGGNGEEGAIRVTQRAGGIFYRNCITRHFGSAAVVVEEGGDPVLESNTIEEHAEDGILVQQGGHGTFCHNIISQCGSSGVVITGPGSAPVFRLNFFLQNKRHGVLWMYDPQGGAVVEKNFFLASGGARCHILLSTVHPQIVAAKKRAQLAMERKAPTLLRRRSGDSGGGGGSGRKKSSVRRKKSVTSSMDRLFRSGSLALSTERRRSSRSGKRSLGRLESGVGHSSLILAAPLSRMRMEKRTGPYSILRGNHLGPSCYVGIVVEGVVQALLHGNTIGFCRHGVLVYGRPPRPPPAPAATAPNSSHPSGNEYKPLPPRTSSTRKGEDVGEEEGVDAEEGYEGTGRDTCVVLLDNRISHCQGGVGVYERAEVSLVANFIQSIVPGSGISVVNASRVGLAFNVILQCQHGIFLHSVGEDALVIGNVLRHCVHTAIYQCKGMPAKSRIFQNVMKENGADIFTSRRKGEQRRSSARGEGAAEGIEGAEKWKRK